LLCISPLIVPATPKAQEGYWTDIQDLCHAWLGDPSGLSMGKGPQVLRMPPTHKD
jgi:hypothetical protein